MVTRRDLMLGSGMLAAAAGAYAMTPRNHLKLLGDRSLEKIVPTTIGNWRQEPSTAFVLPKTEGGLADRLYSQMLTRLYLSETAVPVMLVMAYGDLQSDALQLHRPEVCYTAVGFQISATTRAEVKLAPSARLPVRELTAESDSRVEPILYWTRIGDDLPTDGREQRSMKLAQSLRGIIPDGILVRISTVGTPSRAVFDGLGAFAREMLQAMKPGDRPALIGRPLATGMADTAPARS